MKAQSQPLYKQLQQAKKVLTTQDWMLARDELKSIKAITNIENLKKKNMWSQRQLKRQKTMPRTKTHWDLLLDEMKWMRTDYKEERKWKMANAYMLAQAVMEWHQVPDKSSVCIKLKSSHSISDKQAPSSSPSRQIEPLETEASVSNDVSMPKAQPINTNKAQGTKDTDDEEEEDDDDDEEDDEEEEEEDEAQEYHNIISPQIIQTYNELLQTLNPEQSILLLDDQHQYDMISLLFPDLLLYTAPDSDCIGNDPYFDEAEYSRIVPFKLSTQRIILSGNQKLSRKRNADGDQVKILPRHERYDNTPQVSPLFAPKKSKDAPAIQPPIPKAPSSSSSSSSNAIVASAWSEDDDLCLIQLIIQYSFNWDLICDAFNAIRSSINGEKRTPWDCHERWKQNNLTSLSGQINSGTIIARLPPPQKKN